MTDRERLDQIEQRSGLTARTERGLPPEDDRDYAYLDINWLIVLARRLLAVEEAARDWTGTVDDRNAEFPAWQRLVGALADLDEWRKEQT